jgi:nitrogen fixation/metabolism regulation signal transduction histidine kinase
LRTALEVHRRLGALEAFKEAAETVLDRLPLGVILVDERGQPLMINRSAEEMIERDDGISLKRDGLRAATSTQTAELRKLIRNAALTGC